MSVIRSSIFIVFVCFLGLLNAQEDKNYSARQLKTLGLAAERIGDPESAANYFEAYVEKKPSDSKITFRLADNYRKIGSFEKAKANYRSLYINEKDKFPLAAFYYAQMLTASGNCEEAIPILRQFRKDYRGGKDDTKFLRLAKFSVEGCELGRLDTHSLNKVVIKALPKEINGAHIQGAPIYLPNGDIAYNSLKSDQTTFKLKEDSIPKRKFYVASQKNGAWTDQGFWEMTEGFNEKEIASGAFNVSGTNFYFSACYRNSYGKIDCDLYQMKKNGNAWSSPEPLDVFNTTYTETQIAVGLDEKERETIYFVSDRPGGKGGLDVWYSYYYESRGEFKKPRNCGSKINSVGDEVTPFFNPLNRKLIYSSNGHPGNGGLDVYQAVGQRSRWGEPENLGKHINTPADELYYVIHPEGGEGIFASNRSNTDKSSFCCDDLFYFKETNRIKVNLKGMVKGNGKNGKSNLKVSDAKMKVYQVDQSSGEIFLVQSRTADSEGNFKIVLEPNEDYVIKTEGEGFLTKEENVSTKGIINDKDISLDIVLEEYKDKNIPIGNVYFQFNSATLTEESKAAIDMDLLRTLQNNPTIVVEIASHTDSRGTDSYNLNLSQKRADALTKYLRSKGIAKKRLKSIGYGESQPIAPNENADGSDNPEGRKKNRRIEFKVVGEIELSEDDD